MAMRDDRQTEQWLSEEIPTLSSLNFACAKFGAANLRSFELPVLSTTCKD